MEIIQKIADGLGLTFIDISRNQGNVCFANSPELRPEFRETFTSTDLQNYIYLILHSTDDNETCSELSKVDLSLITIPTDRTDFWKSVQEGKELREVNLLENKNIS